MPGRGSGGMRQRNKIKRVTIASYGETTTNNAIQFLDRNKLRDRQFAYRNDKAWTQDLHFIGQPRRAIANLFRARHAISTGGSFSRETATDSGKVNLRAHLCFSHSAKLAKPAEESAPRCPCERSRKNGFFYSGRLSDENYPAENRSARHRGRNHPRTAPALQKVSDVLIQERLSARCRDHFFRVPITAGRMRK